jgi:hypothetical protein
MFGLALGSSYISSVAVVRAQAKAPAQRVPAEQGEIRDKELKAFAKSYVEFHKLRKVYEPQLSVAKTPQEKGRIEQEAVAKFGAALEREGLTMERYGALFQTVSADERLREKVLKLVEEEQAKS